MISTANEYMCTHTHPHTPAHAPLCAPVSARPGTFWICYPGQTSEAFISLNVFAVETIYETATVECANFIKISHHRAIIRYINIRNLIPSNKDCTASLCMKSDILMTFNPLQMKNTSQELLQAEEQARGFELRPIRRSESTSPCSLPTQMTV